MQPEETRERAPAFTQESRLEVRASPGTACSGGCTEAGGVVTVPTASTAAGLREALANVAGVKILHFSNAAEAFRGFDDLEVEAAFHKRLAAAGTHWCAPFLK
jgi:hypothetical protein